MSLDLEPRQRAMLAEMGVRVWWPLAAPTAPQTQADAPVASIASVTTITAGAPLAAQISVTPANTHSEPTPPSDLAALDWPALQAAVNQCRACAMCQGRRAPVLPLPQPPAQADWFVLGEPPDEAQERAGHAFVGEAGQLLDNMLKAVGVYRQGAQGVAQRQSSAYLSLVLKCRPALPTAPDTQALQACSAFLRREIALVQPKVIVAMGRLAMQLLLSEDHPDGLKLPLGKLRGHVWHFQGVPVVVTYPPSYLLRNGQDKARAWADLCLAADVAEGKVAAT